MAIPENLRPFIVSDAGDRFQFDASLNEQHEAAYDWTSEPIESGAEISDNRVRLQRQLPLRVIVSSAERLGIQRDRDLQAWTRLRQLADADPPLLFTVRTTAEEYENMVIARITWPRAAEGGRALLADIVFRRLEFSVTDVAQNLADAAVDGGLGEVDLGSQGLA